jgi:hypothetical protein
MAASTLLTSGAGSQQENGLRTRKLRVTFHLPGGDVVLDETLNMRVRVEKDCLSSQNTAVIDVTNLTGSVREQLLSQFTALNRRLVNSGRAQPAYLDMQVEAGYLFSNGTDTTSVIYKGQVVQTDLVSGPPNVTVRITCYTHQVDKTVYIDAPPYETTFKGLVLWAGAAMGFDASNIKCDTVFDNTAWFNAARSTSVASELPMYISQAYYPNVLAFIDDDIFYVKNTYDVINPSDVVSLNEFIGIPSWNEWGVEFTTLFDPTIRTAQGVNLTSLLNPGLNGVYVVMGIEYDLTSRETPFYCHVHASPPA